jgi:spore germination protein YaaH
MTLDFAAPGAGPTVDPGWAIDAWRYARSKASATPIDVAMPLYGNDVSDLGTRNVSFLEARALVDAFGARVERGTLGNPHFTYADETGRAHELWYDDADSTARTLRAWDPASLPLEVGVVFYGLGAEDPAVWSTIARALP